MKVIPKFRILTLGVAMLAIATVACADSTTAPRVTGQRSLRDSTVLQGDSTVCRSGWYPLNGRIVCNPEQ